MESTKLNAYRQLVLSRGFRQAIITKITARKWVVSRGWASEVSMTGEKSTVESKATALSYARDWINDQG
jgi:hypothetical protein